MIEFQIDLLRFISQARDGKKYIEVIEEDFFSQDEHATVFSLLKSFQKKYGTGFSLGNILEHFQKEVRDTKSPISKEVYNLLEETIRDSFKPFKANAEHIRDRVIEEYQVKLLKNLIKENALKVKTGDRNTVEDMFRELSRIKRIGDEDIDDEANRGTFLIADYTEGTDYLTEAEPTFLTSLNKMTGLGGFYSPQLIILMGGPKSFKTGVLLNLAVGYTRDGYNVYYADAENGQFKIRDRAKQAMLHVTSKELYSGEFDSVLTQIVDKFKHFGADFRADYYPAHTKTMNDVEAELDYLRDTFNWEPDLIIYDYLDLFDAIDYRIKDKRLQIQAVYHDAIRMQKKRNLFGFSATQVGRDAVKKKVITITDFAEDFGKAANCHAAFALMRDDIEEAAGLMRIEPIAQRDGVKAGLGYACFLEVDEARMMIAEISKKEWEKRYKEAVSKKGAVLELKPKLKKIGVKRLQIQDK